jgi:hypothetical protein
MNLFAPKRIIAMLIVIALIFSLAAVVSAQDPIDNEEEATVLRLGAIISRFSNIFSYVGAIEHEHGYSMYRGFAGLVAAGRGSLGGTHQGWSVEPRRDSNLTPYASSIQSYFASTAQNALPGQYMRMVGGFSIPNSHSVQTGVEVKPGGTGYVNDTMSVSSGYFEHSNSTGSSNGNTRVSSSIEGTSSTTVNVDGFAMYYEKTSIDSGGPKTGWWDIPSYAGTGEGGF